MEEHNAKQIQHNTKNGLLNEKRRCKRSHLPAVQHALPYIHAFATTSSLLLYSRCCTVSCTGEHTCMHRFCMHCVHYITAAAACMRCLCRGCAAFGVTTICRLAVSGCEDGLPAVSFVSVGGG